MSTVTLEKPFVFPIRVAGDLAPAPLAGLNLAPLRANDLTALSVYFILEVLDVLDADGNLLTSLGCIDDADGDYRDLLEAEKAVEAVAELTATQLVDWAQSAARADARAAYRAQVSLVKSASRLFIRTGCTR